MPRQVLSRLSRRRPRAHPFKPRGPLSIWLPWLSWCRNGGGAAALLLVVLARRRFGRLALCSRRRAGASGLRTAARGGQGGVVHLLRLLSPTAHSSYSLLSVVIAQDQLSARADGAAQPSQFSVRCSGSGLLFVFLFHLVPVLPENEEPREKNFRWCQV